MTPTMRERRRLGPEDFERMNLPEAFWKAKIHGVAESVRPSVARYLTKLDELLPKGVGLLISGASGVGKTGVAALAAKEARSLGATVYFTSLWELRECLRAKVQFDNEMSVLDRCRQVDLLVIDDLREVDLQERVFGPFDLEGLFTSRAARKQVNILTTRVSGVELRNKVPSLMNAVKDSMVFMHVEGPDLREQARQEMTSLVLGPSRR